MTQTLKLPWEYRLISMLTNGNGCERAYILIERTTLNNKHPYVVYRLLADGTCEHGDYLEDLDTAQKILITRFYGAARGESISISLD